MNGMECKGEAGQTSKAGQFLRLRHSAWKKLYIQFVEFWKPVQFSQRWSSMSTSRGLKNESGRTILNLLKFFDELLGHS